MLRTLRNGRLVKIAARFAAVGAFAALNAVSGSAQQDCKFVDFACDSPRTCGGKNYFRVDLFVCPDKSVIEVPNGCCYTTV